ncbi:hypothetical protein ACLQ2P_22185 [Actinomadura citrea]
MKPGTPIPPPPAGTDEPGGPARGRGDRRWARGGAALAPALRAS